MCPRKLVKRGNRLTSTVGFGFAILVIDAYCSPKVPDMVSGLSHPVILFSLGRFFQSDQDSQVSMSMRDCGP